MSGTYVDVADWLDAQAKMIREIEESAHKALYDSNNEPEYRSLMKEKAEILAVLADESSQYLDKFSDPVVEDIKSRLERFSFSASSALGIGSVFYMAALLYPDDYKTGEPNDLENFAKEVRAMN